MYHSAPQLVLAWLIVLESVLLKMATAQRDGEGTFKMVAKAFKMAARALGMKGGADVIH